MKAFDIVKNIVLPAVLCTAFSFSAVYGDDAQYKTTEVYLTSDMTYSANSKIHSDPAILYENPNGNGITVCVNAGHGTSGGESQRTLCHPDGSAKVTGGSTAAGSTTATAISSGMTFNDGTSEASVTLAEAQKLKQLLLNRGYNVLMIRENNDTQLDNVARTVLANNYADCHIAIHWDSSSSDKGAFYCSVPNNASYRAMEPVASTWQKSTAFGECLVSGLRDSGRKIFGDGTMEIDLTQTSYSTIPSIDIECGDAASDHSDAALQSIAEGLADGVDKYFADRIKESGTQTGEQTGKTDLPPAEEGRVNVTIGVKKVSVDGAVYETDAAPFIQASSNSTLVPLRTVALAISGGDVANADASENIEWYDKSSTAVIKTESVKVAFTAGSGIMTVNDEPVKMDNNAKAEIKDGRMYIPFRALGEALGVEVEWDHDTSTASYITV